MLRERKVVSKIIITLIFLFIGLILFCLFFIIIKTPDEKSQLPFSKSPISTVTSNLETTPLPTLQTQPDKTIYTIDAKAIAITKDVIEVQGTTNLPDYSNLRISANRIAIFFGEDEERFYLVGVSNTQVKNGKFITKVEIDDKKYLEFLKVSGEIVKKLDPNIEITIIFDPEPRYQGEDSNVVAVIGSKGEMLENSPQKKVYGSLTPEPRNILEFKIRTQLKFPFTEQLPK